MSSMQKIQSSYSNLEFIKKNILIFLHKEDRNPMSQEQYKSNVTYIFV